MYSIWAKLGSLGRGIKMRYNLLLHRNVTKEVVIESVSAIFLSDFFFLFFLLSAFLIEIFFQKYDLYRLDKGPEKSTLNKKDATYALKTMNYIRRMESRAAELYRQRFIHGFLHLYNGQVDEKNLDSAM